MRFLPLILRVVLFAGWGSSAANAAPASQPNVIVVLVDDLGWADPGCYGSRFHETPNVDRLARDGMRFTSAYAACTVCSPTRASLLTGKYPARLHVTDWIPGEGARGKPLSLPDWTQHLSTNEWNLARAFRAAGY